MAKRQNRNSKEEFLLTDSGLFHEQYDNTSPDYKTVLHACAFYTGNGSTNYASIEEYLNSYGDERDTKLKTLSGHLDITIQMDNAYYNLSEDPVLLLSVENTGDTYGQLIGDEVTTNWYSKDYFYRDIKVTSTHPRMKWMQIGKFKYLHRNGQFITYRAYFNLNVGRISELQKLFSSNEDQADAHWYSSLLIFFSGFNQTTGWHVDGTWKMRLSQTMHDEFNDLINIQ